MGIESILKGDDKFKYMMLSRMQSDCEYSINCGYICSHLWGVNVDNHISYMLQIWDSLPKKPVWCRKKQILEYKKQLKIIEKGQ